MQSMLGWMSLVFQAGVLVVLVDIAWHIRKLIAKIDVSLQIGDKCVDVTVAKHHVIHLGNVELTIAFSIWIYRGGSWVLHKPCGQKNCDCGPAPAEPGDYEGKVIRKECPRN